MSSYNQVATKTTVGEAITDAERELTALRDEMAELCASIAAQFAKTHGKIPKYQEALRALNALNAAVSLVERVDYKVHAGVSMTIKLGRQTRRNRPTSQRVRLGNTLVRVLEAAEALQPLNEAWQDVEMLYEIDIMLADITFPTPYG